MKINQNLFILRFKRLQKRRGMDIMEYINYLELPESTVRAWLGGSAPTPVEVALIAAKEGVRVEWLAGMDVPEQPILNDAQMDFLVKELREITRLRGQCEELVTRHLEKGENIPEDAHLLRKNRELDSKLNWFAVMEQLSTRQTG